MKKTIYIIEADAVTWYIDYDNSPNLEKPFEIYQDEHFRGTRRTLSEALLFVMIHLGPGCYTRRQLFPKSKYPQE